MITIKKTKNNDAELIIELGTPHTTMLLGIEMLIEALLEEVPEQNIDDLLADIKRIYIRDNGGAYANSNN